MTYCSAGPLGQGDRSRGKDMMKGSEFLHRARRTWRRQRRYEYGNGRSRGRMESCQHGKWRGHVQLQRLDGGCRYIRWWLRVWGEQRCHVERSFLSRGRRWITRSCCPSITLLLCSAVHQLDTRLPPPLPLPSYFFSIVFNLNPHDLQHLILLQPEFHPFIALSLCRIQTICA